MAIDPGATSLSPREEILWRGQGFLRLLMAVHNYEQDVYGAVDAGQWDMAALAARRLAIEVCSIASIAHGGSPLWSPESVTHDPYSHCPASVRVLADDIYRTAAESPIDGNALLAAVQLLVSDISSAFGMPADMPRTREPDGMYWALSIGRGTLQASERLGLPPVIPPTWLVEGSGVDDGS